MCGYHFRSSSPKNQIVVAEGATVLVLFVYLLKQYKASTGRAFVYGTNQRTHAAPVGGAKLLPNLFARFLHNTLFSLTLRFALSCVFDCYGLFFDFLGDKTAIKLDLDFYLRLLMCSN